MISSATIRVPASTSNLGPGFDCLGVALRLYNHVTITRVSHTPPPAIARSAARLFFRATALRPFLFSTALSDEIPQARGLGSSATIRLGILHGLNRLAGRPLDRGQLFELAAKLEGHPDNAAPASFGGFTVVRAGKVQRFDVSSRLHFVLLIPEMKIATSAARRLLPARLAHADAVLSCANACAVTAAFVSGNLVRLRGALADRLHQPSRKKLVPFLDRVIAAGEKAGALGGFLSGSGSAIICLTLRQPEKVAAAMKKAAPPAARTIVTIADNHGARLMPFRKRQTAIRK
jgi:homoserine kinase